MHAKRSAAAPEIPTIAEGGVEGFGRAGGFIGLFAPAGTPPSIVKSLTSDVKEILAQPHVRANVKNLTASVAYEDDVTFAEFLAAESAKWKLALQALAN